MSRAHTRLGPWALAVALAGAYLAVRPNSADLAAHVYRAGLFERIGFGVWDNGWYAGHHTPGYSVLFPPLAALLGPRLAGALAAVAAAGLFAVLVEGRWGARARWGAVWFAAASATLLLSGRLPFALGVALGLGALVALRAGRLAAAVVLAILCGLASPVAALFLGLAGAALALTGRLRDGLGLGAAALGPVALLALLFPEGGSEPFVLSAYLPVLGLAAAGLLLVPREERTLRIGLVLYALAATAAFAIPTPVGGNAARLGALVGGPILLCAAARRRPAVLALVLVPLAFWQWSAAVRDVAAARGDASIAGSYYVPLLAFLDRQPGPPARVEIPFTKEHWEAARVAPHQPLARGWERQLDRRDNALFYEGRLTPARYRAWLVANGVRWVALADARLDRSARAEARLVRAGLPFLRPAWSGAHWRVWRVLGGGAMVVGPARLTRLADEGFDLTARRAGTVTVRVRFSRWWALTGAPGCVSRAPGGWTRVRLDRAGPARVRIRLALGRVASRGPRCSGPRG